MSAIYPPEHQQSPPQSLPEVRPPPRKRHRVRKTLLIIGGAIVAIIVLVVMVTSLSGKSTPTASPKPSTSTSTSASHPAATQPPSVSQQMTAWFSGGGSAQLKAISNDIGTLQTDMQAYVAGNLTDGTTLQADDATFQSDVQAAQANLPPAGVLGLRSDYNAALTYYNTSATDINNAVIAANSGDYNGAVADVEAGNTALDNGNAKLSAATADVNTYNNS
jgi:hypothetical protein